MKSANIIAVVAALLLASSACEGFGLDPRRTITIKNELGENLPLGVHCKSGSDDLKVHYLKAGESYVFSFRPNFWGTTQFYCHFTFAPNESRWFDIFRARSLKTGHCMECNWKITKTGPCLYNPARNAYDCFSFNK